MIVSEKYNKLAQFKVKRMNLSAIISTQMLNSSLRLMLILEESEFL
jgi:hypothetical protein